MLFVTIICIILFLFWYVKNIKQPITPVLDHKNFNNFLKGNINKLSNKEIIKFWNDLLTWNHTLELLFQSAEKVNLIKRNRLIENNDFNQYGASIVNKISQDVNLELFMGNVFTDTFPSRYDMDTWAVQKRLSDIFVLKGISENDSINYLCHIKNHFVNHKIQTGMIVFDLYHKKS